jgi:predicted deacylase
VPEVRPGDRVAAAQLLGLVRAPIGGDPLETITAERPGVVLGVRVYPMANARELLVRIAE